MASFEEDLAFANKILRIRNAIIDGTLFKDDAFVCNKMLGDNYEITFDYQGGAGVTPIAYLENREESKDNTSYTGYARMIINPASNEYTVMGDMTVYTFLPTPPDEAWHFQASLLISDAALRGAVIMKTMVTNPMDDFGQFIFMPFHLDRIIKRMDNNNDF